MDGSWWRVLTCMVSGITSGIHPSPSLPEGLAGYRNPPTSTLLGDQVEFSKTSYSKYIHKHALPGSLTRLKVLVDADDIIL